MDAADALARIDKPRVLFRSYLDALRRLVSLVTPGVVVFFPVGVAAMLALGPVAGDSLRVVNGDVGMVGVPLGPLVTWSVVVVVVAVAAQVVVLSATVILAAGRLLGLRVFPFAALRAAIRRWRALLVLTVFAVVAVVIVVAAGLWVLGATGESSLAIIMMIIMGLAAVPSMLALPAVLLEGRSAAGGIVRAYRVTHRCYWPTAFTLVVGVLVIPALATRGMGAWLPAVPDPVRAAVSGTATSALALIIICFQASVLARLFLHRITGRLDEPPQDALARIADALPGNGPRLPAALVVTGLVLPGLVYGAAVAANPLGWLEVTETNVTESWTPSERFDFTRRLRLGPGYLRSLHAAPDGRLVMHMDGPEATSMVLTCADVTCRDTTFEWAEKDVSYDKAPMSADATLPDGRPMLAGWMGEGPMDDPVYRLKLLVCDRQGCARTSGDALAKLMVNPVHVLLAHEEMPVTLAVGPGGEPVIGRIREERGPRGEVTETISLVYCADPACADPRPKPIPGAVFGRTLSWKRSVALAVGPDGRVVVAHLNTETDTLKLIACDTAACDRPRATRLTTPVTPEPDIVGDLLDDSHAGHVSLAVRPDGRPVLAYRGGQDGTIRFLDCHTPDCARSTTIPLTGSDRRNAAPALVVDRAGRALVAFQDLDRQRIVIAACDGGRCVRTPVSGIRRGPGERIVMTLDPRGRPVVAWIDDGGRWDLMVTTVSSGLFSISGSQHRSHRGTGVHVKVSR